MARTKQKRGDYVIDWRTYNVTHTPTGVEITYAAEDGELGLVSSPPELITKHPKGKEAGEKLLREILDGCKAAFVGAFDEKPRRKAPLRLVSDQRHPSPLSSALPD
jgi:hypothetical protein